MPEVPSSITAFGVEFFPRAEPSEIKIVRATRGYRDYIYVGRVTVLDNGDVHVAPGGANIRQYRGVGLTGAASDPSYTTLDRCATAITIRGGAVIDILDCGPAWDDVL